MKSKNSIKRNSTPTGWTITELKVDESNELYQLKPSESKVIEETTTEPKKKKLKNGVLIQRSEASQNISEFNLLEIGKERVKLNELIKTSQQSANAVTVKKQLETAKKLQSLSVPLSKPQLEKVKRTVAYEKVCNEVSKWDPIVRSNRVAEQIIFPLKKPALHLETFKTAAEGFVTKHPVELAVNALLQRSEHKLETSKTLTVAEEKALQAMSLEEAKLRHDELMKHRALISYQELKARRQNKIKSKRFHRILKKEKLKRLMKEFEGLQNTDAAAAVEKLMKADNIRVMERMTLKHRNTGKWAKMQKIRAKYNPEARSVLKEDINMGKELKNKIPDIERQITSMKSRIATEIAEDPDCGLIEEPSQLALDDLEEIVPPLELEPFRNLKEVKQPKTTKVSKPTSSSTDTTSDFVNMDFISKATALQSYNPSSVTVGDELDEESDDSGDEGIKNLSEAFADDDIIAEFREDKKARENANKPKGLDLYLPGWGSWGGKGLKESKRKKKKFYINPIEEKPVKKGTIGNVIVNENADKKAAQHQVSYLPFPFTSVQQFESHIRQPVGHTWNPQSSFQSLTAPRIVTKAGKVIQPIDSDDVVLKKVQPVKIQEVAERVAAF